MHWKPSCCRQFGPAGVVASKSVTVKFASSNSLAELSAFAQCMHGYSQLGGVVLMFDPERYQTAYLSVPGGDAKSCSWDVQVQSAIRERIQNDEYLRDHTSSTQVESHQKPVWSLYRCTFHPRLLLSALIILGFGTAIMLELLTS